MSPQETKSVLQQLAAPLALEDAESLQERLAATGHADTIVLEAMKATNGYELVSLAHVLPRLAALVEVGEILVELTKDGRPLPVRIAATSALGEVGRSPHAAARLRELLAERNTALRSAARDALEELDPKLAI